MNPERFILLLSILASAAAFFFPVRKRYEIIQSMSGNLEKTEPERRILRFIYEVGLQGKVILQRPLAGLMHAFVFWGFMAFGLVTLDHFCRGGFAFPVLGHGWVHDFLRCGGVLFAAITMIGINYLAYRRFIEKPKVLGDHLSITSGIVAVYINVLMITYLIDFFVLDEGSALFSAGSTASTVNWWIHALVILAFLALIPRSKHLHLAIGPFTTYFKSFDLAPIKPLDFEKEEFGAESLKDLDKFTGLSAFSCVECGRCLENCPAAQTDKKLNPKQLILDLKEGLLESLDKAVAGETLDVETLWQCTTCGSCTWQCPVGVEHVTPIIETRRGLVAGGEFPSPLKTMFKSMERHQNPWGYTQDQAEEFLEENSYPKFKEQDVLYWMGCLARYDDHYRKASVAFTEKLNEAGVSWGVLYNEICTGDAARRAGNEFVFQEIAAANIEMLNEAAPKKIVTTCPHCLRTLLEYRPLGLDPAIELIHHSTFLNDLASKGRLGGAASAPRNAVFHDACYLSRYRGRDGIREPRAFLRSRNVALSEPKRTREKSFCCGAGGAQFFNEELEGKRINLERIDEILALKPGLVVTACPFCQAMLRDALADRGVEDVEVRDLSQV
jgi:Fe-S oxidoreductase